MLTKWCTAPVDRKSFNLAIILCYFFIAKHSLMLNPVSRYVYGVLSTTFRCANRIWLPYDISSRLKIWNAYFSGTDCGATEFSNSTGNVTSPRYPNLYLHNMHCVYTIEAGPNKTVSLQSLFLRIEGGGGSSIHGYNGCPHDWLIVRMNDFSFMTLY